MKFLIDTLGAPALSGGMRLYAEEVVMSWSESFPQDTLVVVGGTWARSAFSGLANVRVVSWPNDSAAMRMLGQCVVAGLLFRALRADGLISVSPIVSPIAAKRQRVCVVHDWRHMRNQHEFGFLQKAYRKLWAVSLNGAGATISISAKTDAETAQYAPEARRFIVENGRDHARRWLPAVTDPSGSAATTAVTFGHHLNKRPDLVIRAMAEIAPDRRPVLTVLGARGEVKDTLERLSRDLQVDQTCSFPGFVDADEYNRLIQTADVVILASTDEGFGLPVAEAQYFGIPVVSAADSGLDEIHSGLYVAEPEPHHVAVAIEDALGSQRSVSPENRPWTWAQTASEVHRIAVLTGSR